MLINGELVLCKCDESARQCLIATGRGFAVVICISLKHPNGTYQTIKYAECS